MLKLHSTLFGVVVGISLKAFGNLYLLYSIVLSEMGRKNEKVKQTSQCWNVRDISTRMEWTVVNWLLWLPAKPYISKTFIRHKIWIEISTINFIPGYHNYLEPEAMKSGPAKPWIKIFGIEKTWLLLLLYRGVYPLSLSLKTPNYTLKTILMPSACFEMWKKPRFKKNT